MKKLEGYTPEPSPMALAHQQIITLLEQRDKLAEALKQALPYLQHYANDTEEGSEEELIYLEAERVLREVAE